MEFYANYLKYIANDTIEANKIVNRILYQQRGIKKDNKPSETEKNKLDSLVLTMSVNLRKFCQITSVN